MFTQICLEVFHNSHFQITPKNESNSVSFFKQNSINQLIQTSYSQIQHWIHFIPQNQVVSFRTRNTDFPAENTQMDVLLAFGVPMSGTVAAVLQDSISLEGGSVDLGGKLLMSLLKSVMQLWSHMFLEFCENNFLDQVCWF